MTEKPETNTEEYSEDNERYKAIFMTELIINHLAIAATALRNQERFAEIYGKKFGIAQLYRRIAEDLLETSEILSGLTLSQFQKECLIKWERRNIKSKTE